MSFGASPSDVIIVVAFCRALHRKCRDAGGEYDEIRDEVRGLHTVLRHLKYEAEAPESPLNRDRAIWGRQLEPIIGDCDFTLKQLDGLLQKSGSILTGYDDDEKEVWKQFRRELSKEGFSDDILAQHKDVLRAYIRQIDQE
ncbi:hypothetical protein BGZ57DRAFT_732038, partial [Hyaloscypha finlandica]